MLCRPLTDFGCMYASYFTSAVTLEVKVEWGSDLRVEQSLQMGAGWSSDLGVGWNLEQQKCEIGCPLTGIPWMSQVLDLSPASNIFAAPHSSTLISLVSISGSIFMQQLVAC